MKSKISFFNKTIFLKNVTLYWPIWVVYTLSLLLAMPFSLWLSVHDRYNIEGLTEVRMIREIYYVFEPQYYICVIAFAAVIAGMALFSYLYKSQSANMIHSLPVDRTELFGTNVLSGLAFLIVPQVLTFVITILVCLSEGITRVEYIAMWLLFAVATAVIAFSFVTICAFFTGQLVAMPIYVILLNVLALAISGVVTTIVEWFGYGVIDNGLLSSDVLMWFSPFLHYLAKVDVNYTRDALNNIDGLYMSGVECMIVYFIVAIGLYVLAYFVYRFRKIEQAGELITVEALKPVFRWGVGTICGFYVTWFFAILFDGVGFGFSYLSFSIGLLFFGILFYFVADMFVRKTFRVFKKRNWKGCGLFCIALVLTFAGMVVYANMEERYVPNKKDVSTASVNMGYYAEYDGEDIEKIIKIHEMILEDLDYYERLEESYTPFDQTESIHISYTLKSGKIITRRYELPCEQDGQKIINMIRELETEPHNLLTNLLGKDYADLNKLSFSYGYIDIAKLVRASDSQGNVAGVSKVEEVSKELTSSQTAKLYQAIIADGLEGCLAKYNAHYNGDYINTKTYHISIEVFKRESDNKTRGLAYDSGYNNYINVTFGEDCENIIRAITELGIEGIDSPEDIYWGKFYED